MMTRKKGYRKKGGKVKGQREQICNYYYFQIKGNRDISKEGNT